MRMKFPVLLILLAGLGLAACGGDEGISGSQCGLISCGYDRIECEKYFTAEGDAIRINYLRNLEEGTEYTAVIIISIPDGTEQVEGLHIEEAFVDLVTLYRPPPGEQWPDYETGQCDIKKGGDELGKALEGKCAFLFVNGYNAAFRFKCTMENALPD
jgi:hypothetical protein